MKSPKVKPTTEWEMVRDGSDDRVRRMEVPGGWLYQVEVTLTHEPGVVDDPRRYTFGWSPPVFVAEPERKSREWRP